jgi:glutaminyl-tRNA synthetase
MENTGKVTQNFIKNIVDSDLKSGKHKSVITRFPPEPNGYLHIGHAKSICLNFGLALDYQGRCHLRFDDTNPEKEEEEYVESIKKDVKWLGFDWNTHEYYASDYFQKLFEYACELIKMDKAFVDELTSEEMRKYRGNLSEPGKKSPFRDRPVEESLDLFKKMRNGEFPDGKYTLRAKIDMSSPNINMRDPALYRIKRAHHQRTGDDWPIYPMYDYAHPLSDALEAITHSICTLEFENHRPLYDWLLETLKTSSHPQQIEFARLNLEYTVMSKRKLLRLVEEKLVDGWDDPRLPTISGMRRRGYTARSIRNFSERIGVTKKDSVISISTLEHAIREDLELTCPRAFGVLKPLKITITNYPQDKVEEISASFHPKDESFGKRNIPFSNEIYIESEDFMENPPADYFRLSPGKSVRLRFAYVITCDEVIKNNSGEVVELKCRYHQETFAGAKTPEFKHVKGIIHWVCAKNAHSVQVRLYDRLFLVVNPGEGKNDFIEDINPKSLEIVTAKVEPSLKNVKIFDRYQFERMGYFILDEDGIYNRIITLRDKP